MNPFSERVPPQDLAAERAVLGSCIVDEDVLVKVQQAVAAEDFYSDKHQQLFEAITNLRHRREPVDLITLQEELRKRDRLDGLGGLGYLTSLVNGVPTTANVEAYAAIVADKATLRRLQQVARQIVEDCYSAETVIQARLKAVEDIQRAVSSGKGASVVRHLGNTLLEYLEQSQNDRLAGDNSNIVRTMFREQDKRVPMERGTVTVVPSPSSMGKTTWMFNLLIGTAKLGEPAIGFSLEMSDRQILQKTWANVARINTLKIRHLALNDSDWSNSTKAVVGLLEIPAYYALKRRMKFTDIRIETLAFKAKHGKLGLVAIDYWQIIGDRPERGERKDELLGRLIEEAKDLAIEADCKVVILAQAKIDSTKPVPALEDVKESRAVVEAADDVFFLTRPVEFGSLEIRLPTQDGKQFVKCHCDDMDPADHNRRMFDNVMLGIPGKARLGPKDIVPYYIELETGRMGDLATPWPWDNPRGIPRKQEI